MQNLLRRLRKLKANSFTLVELLVVISIIGLLAGLAVPAIQGALDRAKQGVDVSNVRQLGILFFSEANDNNGIYRVNAELTNTSPASDFTTICKAMVSNGIISTTKILAGNGVPPAVNTNNLGAGNIAWAYVTGLDVAYDGQMPLLFTKGPQSLASGTAALESTYPWKTKGMVVYRVGNFAEFLRASNYSSTAGTVGVGVNVSNKIIQP
jgi:prepilin-type N-terminal cleavage/methylation domain-containing protein